MYKRHTLLILVFTLLAATSSATHFAEMGLEEQVRSSQWILVAQVKNLQCIDVNNQALRAGQRCTGPGEKNKMAYDIVVTETLYKSPQLKKDTSKDVHFEFTSMGHTTVPEDEYAGAQGKKLIFFLRRSNGGPYAPIHEAFFIKPLEEKANVRAALKKKKNV